MRCLHHVKIGTIYILTIKWWNASVFKVYFDFFSWTFNIYQVLKTFTDSKRERLQLHTSMPKFIKKKKKHICNIYNFRSWIYTNRKFPVVATQNNAGKHKKFPLQAKTINCLNTTGSTYLPVTSMQPQNKKENNKIATILYSQLLFWSSTWFVILIWH